MQLRDSKNLIFLIWLLLIELCWILGTKVSEMLLDYISDLSFEEIQIAESLFNYAIVLTIFFWGYLVDRYNDKRKMLLILSSAIWICASFILYFTLINFTLYCVVQIMWGLSFGANGPLIASYLGDLFKIENRGKLFSIFTLFIYIIKGSNIAVNGLIGVSLNNWRAPTFIFAILGIFVIIGFYFFIKEPVLALNEPEFKDKMDNIYNYHPSIDEVQVIIKKKTNMLFLLQGIFGMIGVVVVTRYINYWFTSQQYDGLGINIGLAILLLGAGGAVGGLLGIIFVGRWIDRYFKQGQVHKILFFAIICIFLQSLLYSILILIIQYPDSIDKNIYRIDLFLQAYPAFIGFILIFNLCVFCGTPIGTTVGVARTHVNLPEHRGTAGALYDLTDFIGSGIGILIASLFLMISSSYRLTIMYGAMFWLISGLIWIYIAKSFKQDYEETRRILKKRANS